MAVGDGLGAGVGAGFATLATWVFVFFASGCLGSGLGSIFRSDFLSSFRLLASLSFACLSLSLLSDFTARSSAFGLVSFSFDF